MENYFIITIDTEGDNLWKTVIRPSGMRNITVRNAVYIERFQRLCEKYYFIPTYLVNYEMAHAEPFAGMAKEWVKDKKCEIGMHMHAWNTPPIYELPYKHGSHNPYAGEYPREILWNKLNRLTELLEERFAIRPVSHRGGRWYIDAWYVRALEKLGYIVDCTVTPGVSWDKHIGNHMYGTDYSIDRYRGAYQLSRINIHKCGDSGVYEVPPTIISTPLRRRIQKIAGDPQKIGEKLKEKIWLRPNGINLSEMLYIVEKTKNRNYIEFMLHSSELMPGGSPTFKTAKSIEKLYADLDILFSEIKRKRVGITLSGYVILNKK